jgi:hypothetical protein
MTFWHTGDEEHEDPRFRAVPGGLGLYVTAGSWCMSRVRYRPEAELPAEWFIPDEWVKGQPSGRRIAAGLERQCVWERLDGGYRYAWIRYQNTPDYVRRQRKREREKKAKRHANSQGESTQFPRGESTAIPQGDI